MCNDPSKEGEAYQMHCQYSQMLLKDHFQSSQMAEHNLIFWLEGSFPLNATNPPSTSTQLIWDSGSCHVRYSSCRLGQFSVAPVLWPITRDWDRCSLVTSSKLGVWWWQRLIYCILLLSLEVCGYYIFNTGQVSSFPIGLGPGWLLFFFTSVRYFSGVNLSLPW